MSQRLRHPAPFIFYDSRSRFLCKALPWQHIRQLNQRFVEPAAEVGRRIRQGAKRTARRTGAAPPPSLRLRQSSPPGVRHAAPQRACRTQAPCQVLPSGRRAPRRTPGRIKRPGKLLRLEAAAAVPDDQPHPAAVFSALFQLQCVPVLHPPQRGWHWRSNGKASGAAGHPPPAPAGCPRSAGALLHSRPRHRRSAPGAPPRRTVRPRSSGSP